MKAREIDGEHRYLTVRRGVNKRRLEVEPGVGRVEMSTFLCILGFDHHGFRPQRGRL